MKVITRVFLFITITLNIFAQTGTLKGKVVDKETGEPLIGANVIIKEAEFRASSDIEGNYKIYNILPGTYLITVSYIGYKTIQIDNARIVAYESKLNFELENGDPSEIISHPRYIPENLTNSFIIPVRSLDLSIKGFYFESFKDKLKIHPLQMDSIKQIK